MCLVCCSVVFFWSVSGVRTVFSFTRSSFGVSVFCSPMSGASFWSGKL